MAEAASVSQIARSRERLRPPTNGAAATRAVPRIPPSAAAQASEGWSELPAQDRDDREGHQRERPDEEAGCEEQVGAQPVDGEPTGGENRNEEPGKRHRGLQHEQERGRVVLRP